VRYQRTESFKADYKRLSDHEKEMFRAAAVEFNLACDRFVAAQEPWPKRLRVKDVESAAGVWEMTWSFSGPDGRATWEWLTIEVGDAGTATKVPCVLWRRIGGHKIFKDP
jgi:hypothetical protein